MPSPRHVTWLDYFLMNSWFIGLGSMWNGLHRFLLPAIVPIIVGVSIQATALSELLFAGLVVAVIVQPISGAISDRSLSRWGRRRPMMAVWTFIDLLFLAGIAYAPNFFFLFAAYCGLQFASNIAHGPAQGLIPDLVPENQRGAASGVKNFIDDLTVILAGLVTGSYILGLGPDLIASSRLALLLMGVLLVLFLIVNVLTTPESPITAAEAPREPLRESVWRSLSVVGNIGEVARENRPYAWLILTRLLFTAAVSIVGNYAQLYFKDVVLAGNPNAEQLAPGLMGSMLVVVAVMLVAVSVPAGVLSDRWGRKPVSAAGGLFPLAGGIMLLFIRNVTLFTVGGFTVSDFMAVGMCIGIGVGIFFAANWAWATDLISQRDAARYLGISNLATAGSGVIASIGGPRIDIGNRQSFGAGYQIVFAIGAVWFLLSILILPLIRETRGRRAVPVPVGGT